MDHSRQLSFDEIQQMMERARRARSEGLTTILAAMPKRVAHEACRFSARLISPFDPPRKADPACPVSPAAQREFC